MISLPPDPYHAFDLPRDADSTTIKSTYRKLVLKYHPDKVGGHAEEFYKVQQAYELIGDPIGRKMYDLEFELNSSKKARKYDLKPELTNVNPVMN
jgi:curved DNA-binding protein CbpA